MLSAVDEEEKKLFFSSKASKRCEVYGRLPPATRHDTEVRLFRLLSLRSSVRVTTLFEFLLKIYEQNCGGFHDLVCHVVTEVIEGLGYLHNQRIAHGQHFSQQPALLLLVVTGG